MIGDVAACIYAADSAFTDSVRLIDVAIESGNDGGDTAFNASWRAVEAAQLVATTNVLEAVTVVFDAFGSSGTSTTLALDRHWRNARTVASHNPRITRARDLGGSMVNGWSAPRTGNRGPSRWMTVHVRVPFGAAAGETVRPAADGGLGWSGVSWPAGTPIMR